MTRFRWHEKFPFLITSFRASLYEGLWLPKSGCASQPLLDGMIFYCAQRCFQWGLYSERLFKLAESPFLVLILTISFVDENTCCIFDKREAFWMLSQILSFEKRCFQKLIEGMTKKDGHFGAFRNQKFVDRACHFCNINKRTYRKL